MTPRIRPGDGDPRHGTANAYANLDCRCDACRQAATEYARSRKIGAYRESFCECGNPKKATSVTCQSCHDERTRVGHGSSARYREGCRCEACKAWARESKRVYREARMVPCVGCGVATHARTPGNGHRSRSTTPYCPTCSQRVRRAA